MKRPIRVKAAFGYTRTRISDACKSLKFRRKLCSARNQLIQRRKVICNGRRFMGELKRVIVAIGSKYHWLREHRGFDAYARAMRRHHATFPDQVVGVDWIRG